LVICAARVNSFIHDKVDNMTFDFQELDYQVTPLGDISLRRRSEPRLGGTIVYEVKLGNEFLMSSLFTEAEIQLARLGLAALDDSGDNTLDIVVGGLGLGYTAHAVLELSAVRSLAVVEVMKPVIDWHRRGLVPLGEHITTDSRCKIIHGDFFELAAADRGGSPNHWLNPANSAFYSESGLRGLAAKLHPGGIFGLWSNDPPNDTFIRLLDSVFESSEAHVVTFSNPYSGGQSSNTVYLARNIMPRPGRRW
jgi:spermidine synthase